MECEMDYLLRLFLSIIHIFLQDLLLSEHWNCMLNAAEVMDLFPKFSVVHVNRTS